MYTVIIYNQGHALLTYDIDLKSSHKLIALKLTSKSQLSSNVTSVPALYVTEISDHSTEASIPYDDATVLLSGMSICKKNLIINCAYIPNTQLEYHH